MIATATKLDALPATDAAVRAGVLSVRQAEMVAGAARVNPAAEAGLLAAAREGMVPLRDACVRARAEAEDPAARSERQHRARFVRIWNDPDGMVAGRFALTPEVGGQVKAVLDDLTRRVFRTRRSSEDHDPMEAYAADALTHAILGVPEATSGADPATSHGMRDGSGASARVSGSGVRATVHVLVDHAALVRGAALPGETCEIPGVGPVNVDWVRYLLGDAFVTAVIRKGRDIRTVAHFGRHIPAVLRTALVASGRECDIAGCHHRGYLEIDHAEIDHAKGGPTAWWNLTWLCSVHHRRKTAGARLGPPDPTTRKRRLVEPDHPQPATGRSHAA